MEENSKSIKKWIAPIVIGLVFVGIVGVVGVVILGPTINDRMVQNVRLPVALQTEIDRVCGEGYHTADPQYIMYADSQPNPHRYESPTLSCTVIDTFPISMECDCPAP